jgi:hypothetical protein
VVVSTDNDNWEDGERKILAGFSFGGGVTDSTESVSESEGIGFFFLALGAVLGLTALRLFVFFFG